MILERKRGKKEVRKEEGPGRGRGLECIQNLQYGIRDLVV